jgi:hypothetical protein
VAHIAPTLDGARPARRRIPSTPAAQSFAQLEADYRAALDAAAQAKARLRVAGDAWMAAQCGILFATSPAARAGHHTQHRCTLEHGHADAHSNASTRAATEAAR